ncbi:15486_t:CDS:2 [Funneliformis geosporum]|uniref:Mitochondrial fission 1 protein n=1 Tax=Funneliformis geosporum TaxID=1117311 RepID=A0A9W4SZT7_9GLOM|nr:3119_t:CDS:2 [Funneliformis geosporum]CAI2185352.1 15486_t:CDS:2 [Funneliformis geosporum]
MNDLPYAADVEASLSAEELNVLRRQYDREVQEGDVTTQTKFNYAWGLIKGRRASDQQLGVSLLSEIFNDIPERRRECLYYLALGCFKLGKYTEARDYNDRLLKMEPKNLQAQSLKELIKQKLEKDGIVGMAIIGGVVAVSALIVGTIFNKNKR